MTRLLSITHLESQSIKTSRSSSSLPFSFSNLRQSAITSVRAWNSLLHSRYVPTIDLARRIGFSTIDNLHLAKKSSRSHKILQTHLQIPIMESLPIFMANEDTTSLQLSSPSSADTDSDHDYGSNSSFSFLDDLQPTTRTVDEHISTLRSLEQSDFSNEEGIKALPRRRNKSQRPLAIELAKILYPELTEIAAIIKYERLISPAKSIVRDKQKARLAPKNQAKLLKVQGPWAGQSLDPIDLKGPAATPMPVEIGKAEDFAPIFGFLAHESFEDASRNGFKPNFDFLQSLRRQLSTPKSASVSEPEPSPESLSTLVSQLDSAQGGSLLAPSRIGYSFHIIYI
jgi:hypothetical protein